MRSLTVFSSVGVLLVPLTVLAQFESIGVLGLLDFVLSVIDTLILIVLALAVLFFFWGLAKFILNAGNKEAVEEGRRLMIWGIIALVVMTSVWGIVGVIQKSLFPNTDPGGVHVDDSDRFFFWR